MDNLYLSHIVAEIAPSIRNRTVRQVWMAGHDFVLEWKGSDGQKLVVSADPSNPGLYLTREHLASSKPAASEFISTARERLIGMNVVAILKHPVDRLVKLGFDSEPARASALLLSLIGRATNIYILDCEGETVSRLFNHAREAGRICFDEATG